ncbi:NAD-dependent protein deacetylases [Pelotomaculum thermopropionicum SI]|uniref:NAD-dependent protein deacetylases n=1 Tax=Pelotomaculum thermopropionicum (strain DSM 13744 / JCM 10971 / SI) TaxID=370438 RepID=A5D0N0_PELTS|nr:NAD-dependent protein deacetylases [Pelotomaculum thermopropionicum SI]
MKAVYIFGAGASAAEGAPVVRNFFRMAYRYFKEEQYDAGLEIVWEFLEHFYGKRSVISSGSDLDRYPGIDEIFNIVDWYLLHNQAFSARFPQKRLDDLKTALVKLISMTLDRSLPPDNSIHRSFVLRALQESREVPTFISLNYDIVLDRAIRAAGCRPEYGFYGSHRDHLGQAGQVPLYKLHGSLNWSFCPLCGEIAEHNEKVAHLLFSENSPIVCMNCGGANPQAVIIAPTLYKSYKISRLQNVWDSACAAISQCDRLVVIGYSLDPADTSIIATLKRALNAPDKNREIVVINPSRRTCGRYRQIFGNGCKIKCRPFTGELF